MKNFTVAAIDEFEMVYRMGFESLSEALECFSEWFKACESGETPLYTLELLEGSEILEKYDFLVE
jgi:hypothetical protein